MRTLSTDRGPGESILFVIVTKMVWTLYMVYMPRLLDADARHSCLQCCSRQQTVAWAGLGTQKLVPPRCQRQHQPLQSAHRAHQEMMAPRTSMARARWIATGEQIN